MRERVTGAADILEDELVQYFDHIVVSKLPVDDSAHVLLVVFLVAHLGGLLEAEIF